MGIPEDPRPHVRLIRVHPDSFKEISVDVFTIKDFEKNRPSDYRLDFIEEDGLFFILGPKDIIKAMPRSFDDHIKWLIERNNFEKALDDIKNAELNSLKLYNYELVALNYIEYLIFSKEFKEAAEWCSRIALSSKHWEEKILIFAKEGQLEVCYLFCFFLFVSFLEIIAIDW